MQNLNTQREINTTPKTSLESTLKHTHTHSRTHLQTAKTNMKYLKRFLLVLNEYIDCNRACNEQMKKDSNKINY